MTEWTQSREPAVGVVASKLNTLIFDYISHLLHCTFDQHRLATRQWPAELHTHADFGRFSSIHPVDDRGQCARAFAAEYAVPGGPDARTRPAGIAPAHRRQDIVRDDGNQDW